MPPEDRRQFLKFALALGAISTPLVNALAAPAIEDVLYDPANPVLGNPKGDVTIVEFFEYQCTYCRQIHPELKRLVAQDGRIRLVMKDWLIFGDLSLYASRMALAAQYEGRYAEAMQALMTTRGLFTLRRIEDALRGAKIDVNKLRDALELHIDRIEALLGRTKSQAKTFGLPGTPAFIIGTTLYPGVMDVPALKEAIAKARA